jgi:hypothetical protein
VNRCDAERREEVRGDHADLHALGPIAVREIETARRVCRDLREDAAHLADIDDVETRVILG